MQQFRVFISSPGDAAIERRRAENVASRLNGEFAGLAQLLVIRWETEQYKAHETFQPQIPPATECDVVIGILRWRLGTPLPKTFPDRLPGDEAYPSGTAYEILTSIQKRKKGSASPDVYVFRYKGSAPLITIGEPEEDTKRVAWAALCDFIARWFQRPSGEFEAAFNSYQSEDDFEFQLETLLRKWLADKVASGRIIPWPLTKRSPFRGLGVFGARHAPVFFGRSADIRRAMDLWRDYAARNQQFLLIIGASGAGKSSLARAGLIPRLTTPGVIPKVDRWRVAAMRPSDSPAGPFASLAAALFQSEAELPPEEKGRGDALPEIAAGDFKTPTELTAVLADASTSIVRVIIHALDRVSKSFRATEHFDRSVRTDLVLLIDQLDELFIPSIATQLREDFANFIAALLASGRVWVVATLRADLYQSMLKVDALKELKDKGASYDLAPPGAPELAEIVREPAKAAALTFEMDKETGERLDERLLREADRPDMLPLVQLALSKLWEARITRGSETTLSLAAFEAQGGVKGIIEEAGETALAELGETELGRLAPLLRRLAEVAPGASGGPETLSVRAVPIEEASPTSADRKLIDALVRGRLLTLSGQGEATTVRLAHQRVLADWARAATIVAESAEFYKVRDGVEAQRRRWAEAGKRGELLLARGLPLAEARAIVDKYGHELTDATKAFVSASRRRANRALAIAWTAVAVFAAAAIAAGISTDIALRQKSIAANALADAANNYHAVVEQAAGTSALLAYSYEDGSISTTLMRPLMAKALAIVSELKGNSDDVLSARVRLLDDLAITNVTSGNISIAREFAEQEKGIADELLAKNADDLSWRRLWAIAHGRLSDVLFFQGDLPDALRLGREAVAEASKIVMINPADEEMQRSLFFDYQRVADPLRTSGDVQGATKEYRLWLDHTYQLRKLFPNNPQWLRALAFGHERMGDILIAQDNAIAAEEQYKAFYNFAAQAVTMVPQNAMFKDARALSHQRLGDAERDQGHLPEALSEYKQYQSETALLFNDLDSSNFRWHQFLEIAHQRIGEVLMLQNKPKNAYSEYVIYEQMAEDALKTDPSQGRAIYDLANAHEKVGDALFKLEDYDHAIQEYQTDLAMMVRLVHKDTTNAEWLKSLAIAHERLASVFAIKNMTADAINEFKLCALTVLKATVYTPRDVWPRDATTYCHAQLDALLESKSSHR